MNLHILVILMLLVLGSPARDIMAQFDARNLPSSSGEKVYLHIDRPAYTILEKVYYSVVYEAPESGLESAWSTVMYVELIKWDGTKLAQSKVSIEDHLAAGSLQIPATLESGNYYLRAYTKWMRNYSPYEYAYVPLKVINPYSRMIDQGPDALQKNGPEYIRGDFADPELLDILLGSGAGT